MLTNIHTLLHSDQTFSDLDDNSADLYLIDVTFKKFRFFC